MMIRKQKRESKIDVIIMVIIALITIIFGNLWFNYLIRGWT